MSEANEGGANAQGRREGAGDEQDGLQAEQESAEAMDAEVEHGADDGVGRAA
jgi:hypothetical protein